MRRYSASLLIARWTEMPNPYLHLGDADAETAVVVRESAIHHIIQRHVKVGVDVQSEPMWKEWLDESLWEELQTVEPADIAGRRLLQRFASYLQRGAQRACARPCVLVYFSRGPKHRQGNDDWLLIAPTGAVLIIGTRTDENFLKTSFFTPSACFTNDPERRWAATMREMVQRYSSRHYGQRYLPGQEFSFNSGAGERRSDFLYITAESWGFDEHGCWRGVEGTYDSLTRADATAVKLRLQPRFRPSSSEVPS